MKKIKLFFTLIFLCLLFSFGGCEDTKESVTPAKLIGLSFQSSANDYENAVISQLRSSFSEKGYTLIITNANGRTNDQIRQLEALKNVDANSIIFNSSKEEVSEKIENLHNAGIPLINIFNVLENQSNVDAVITNNYEQSGKAVADLLNSLLTNGGRYQGLYLLGEVTDEERLQKIKGISENLNGNISQMSNPLSCVDSLSAVNRAKTIISRDVSACVAFDDASIDAFVNALGESEKNLNEVKLIVFSGSPHSKKLLKEGKISAVVFHSTKSMTSAIVEICMNLIDKIGINNQIKIDSQTITPANIANFDVDNWQ